MMTIFTAEGVERFLFFFFEKVQVLCCSKAFLVFFFFEAFEQMSLCWVHRT